jgi:acyl transferase domain-containing protein
MILNRLKAEPMYLPNLPVIANSLNIFRKPFYYKSVSGIRRILAKQQASPVYFDKALNLAYGEGNVHFIEVGAGTVLSGIAKQNFPDDDIRISSTLELLKAA